jgi:hypothetical protein
MAEDTTPEQRAIEEKREALREIEERREIEAATRRTPEQRAIQRNATLSVAYLVLWAIATPVIGFGMFLAYAISAALEGAPATCSPGLPFGGWAGGGQASSISGVTAALLGVILAVAWGMVAYVAASRREHRLGSFFGFPASYAVALALLWFVSPLILGPRHC